jgi:hypothetical protein
MARKISRASEICFAARQQQQQHSPVSYTQHPSADEKSAVLASKNDNTLPIIFILATTTSNPYLVVDCRDSRHGLILTKQANKPAKSQVGSVTKIPALYSLLSVVHAL